MADEFVDLYELLGLPLDAERDVLRKRINELYLEAQRNLDHRNFQTRVHYQELFEVRMPQARYILLDAGRRAEYDRMVSAMRGTPQASSAAPPPSKPKPSKKNEPAAPSLSNPALGSGSTAGFKLAAPETEVAGKAPTIEPLPVSGFDSERQAKERDDLWRKWKSGLEEALAREKEAEQTYREAPVAPAASSPAPRPTKAAQPQSPTQFDGQANDDEAREQERLLQQQQEQRRTEHRRKIMKDMLEGAGLKGMVIGVFAVLVPGVIAMLAFMAHYYPRGAKPLLQLPQNLAWLIWGVVIAVGAFVAAQMLSKSMRRNMASELNSLSYETLVRRASRG